MRANLDFIPSLLRRPEDPCALCRAAL